MAEPETLGVRFPTVTLTLALVAVIVYCWPSLPGHLVYDRQAILHGEIWRLVTAPVVHFSTSHIFWDLVVFIAAGWRIEVAGYRRYGLVCCLAAVVPGSLFLLFSPELARYGGLSGLATGAVVYLCLCEAYRTGGNRVPWLAILALTVMKVFVESVTGAPLFASEATMPFRVLPAAHSIGIAAALITFFWAVSDTRLCPGRQVRGRVP